MRKIDEAASCAEIKKNYAHQCLAGKAGGFERPPVERQNHIRSYATREESPPPA
jgi:hypothetical protein